VPGVHGQHPIHVASRAGGVTGEKMDVGELQVGVDDGLARPGNKGVGIGAPRGRENLLASMGLGRLEGLPGMAVGIEKKLTRPCREVAREQRLALLLLGPCEQGLHTLADLVESHGVPEILRRRRLGLDPEDLLALEKLDAGRFGDVFHADGVLDQLAESVTGLGQAALLEVLHRLLPEPVSKHRADERPFALDQRKKALGVVDRRLILGESQLGKAESEALVSELESVLTSGQVEHLPERSVAGELIELGIGQLDLAATGERDDDGPVLHRDHVSLDHLAAPQEERLGRREAGEEKQQEKRKSEGESPENPG
jgi:hypothetical protein